MFTTGENSLQDSGSGNGGSLLVPTQFVWPYGGRRVYLIGSFTRWTEHLQMTPVEGRPTIFHAICRLAPGLHQYKFIVDGEWRHDEHQPVVAGNYGIVNTVDLSRGPSLVPTIPNLEPSPSTGMNMEVDPVNFQRVVSVSHDTLDDYMASSHRCVTEFLINHTAYDLLPDSGKVIMLDVNLPVKQAFHILHEQGIPVAPLWDSQKGQFVGMLSALDFILILRELGNHGSNLTEDELETHAIYAWKEGKRLMNGPVDPQGRPYPRHLIHASPHDSLKEVALKILHNAVTTVPIIHSSAGDGSFPQLLHLASLSGVLKCICRHFRHSSSSLPILHQPIDALPLGSWLNPHNGQSSKPLAMLRPNDSLSTALSLLVQAGVSCLPIVDDNNSLLDIYSRSDITALAKDRAYAQIRLDETSVHQALQLGHCDASPQFGFFNGQRCQMCLRTDPLLKVMERLSNPGVRRVIVIEAGSKRVEGLISLSDVFKFLIPF